MRGGHARPRTWTGPLLFSRVSLDETRVRRNTQGVARWAQSEIHTLYFLGSPLRIWATSTLLYPRGEKKLLLAGGIGAECTYNTEAFSYLHSVRPGTALKRTGHQVALQLPPRIVSFLQSAPAGQFSLPENLTTATTVHIPSGPPKEKYLMYLLSSPNSRPGQQA